MRIAFISDGAYPWFVGGIETVERTEAEELAKKHDVHFFCARWPGMQSDFLDKGIHYHTLFPTKKEKFYRHGRRSIRAALFFALSTLKIFRYRFDVIQVNMFPFLHLPVLKIYCKLTGCKMILDCVEVWDQNYWNRYIGGAVGKLAYVYTGFFFSSSNAYIANSTATAKRLLDSGINKERISVFMPILDDRLLSGVKRNKVKKQVFFSGRMIKEKRIDKWLDAVGAASRKVSGLSGLVVGAGPDRAEISAMIKEKGLSNIVKTRGFYKSTRDVYSELARSALLLQMSEREGFSIIVLESIALGVPVLLPTYSPIPKELKDMCIVANEEDIPSRIAAIASGRGPKGHNRADLERFYRSKVPGFYAELLGRLGKNQ